MLPCKCHYQPLGKGADDPYSQERQPAGVCFRESVHELSCRPAADHPQNCVVLVGRDVERRTFREVLESEVLLMKLCVLMEERLLDEAPALKFRPTRPSDLTLFHQTDFSAEPCDDSNDDRERDLLGEVK